MATETYSKSTDFPNSVVNLIVFYEEITDDASITTQLDDVQRINDVVNAIFAASLSAPEKTALDALVAAHQGVFSAKPDTSSTGVVFDHFMSSSILSGEIGQCNWRLITNGPSSGLDLKAAPGHPGIALLMPGVGAAGRAALVLGEPVRPLFQVGGKHSTTFEILVKFGGSLLSTDLEMFQAGVALPWNANGEVDDGVYLKFDPSASSSFSVNAADGGIRTTSPGTTTVIINKWYRVGFTIDDKGTSIQLHVDGHDEGSPVTTNIPTGTDLLPGMKQDSGDTAVTEAVVRVDYYSIRQIADA